MTSNTLEIIKNIIQTVKTRREALDDYHEKLENAKTRLVEAKKEREKSFSFETDTKVVELESFVGRITTRYTEEKNRFDEWVPEQLRSIEDLFDKYVAEKWVSDTNCKELEAETVASFKKTVDLLKRYKQKPSEVKESALQDIKTEDFNKAFKGQLTFLGANSYLLADAIPLLSDTFGDIYSVGRQLGVEL